MNARRYAAPLGLSLALWLNAGTGQAIAADTTVIVEPDMDAYRLSETAMLDADVRAASNDTAKARAYQVGSLATAEDLSVYIKQGPETPRIVERLTHDFAGNRDITFTVTPVLSWRITYTPQALAATPFEKLGQNWRLIDRFVKSARPDPAGVEIARDVDSVVVHLTEPTTRAAFAARIRRYASQSWMTVSGKDDALRLTIDPEILNSTREGGLLGLFDMGFDPARRLTLPEAMAAEVRDLLREPSDLYTRFDPEGLTVFIPNPDRYPTFTDKLQRAFVERSGFVSTTEPAWLLRAGLISPPVARTQPQAMFDDAIPQALTDAWAKIDAIADPAAPEIETKVIPNGLAARAVDPAFRAERAAAIRRNLGVRTDITFTTDVDQWLRITFTPGALETRRPPLSALAQNVRTCVDSLKLGHPEVSIDGAARIAVDFTNEADAAAFRRLAFGHCFFSIRVVDSDASADADEASPNPGDQRLPQTAGGDLWLKAAPALTADMIADAQADIDQGGQPSIRFSLTEEGRRRFAVLTATNVGSRFAVVSDGQIVSAPRIMEAITGGKGEISGNFTAQSARAIAGSILAGRSSFPLRVIDNNAERRP